MASHVSLPSGCHRTDEHRTVRRPHSTQTHILCAGSGQGRLRTANQRQGCTRGWVVGAAGLFSDRTAPTAQAGGPCLRGRDTGQPSGHTTTTSGRGGPRAALGHTDGSRGCSGGRAEGSPGLHWDTRTAAEGVREGGQRGAQGRTGTHGRQQQGFGRVGQRGAQGCTETQGRQLGVQEGGAEGVVGGTHYLSCYNFGEPRV